MSNKYSLMMATKLLFTKVNIDFFLQEKFDVFVVCFDRLKY